jgi:hypothetical protein
MIKGRRKRTERDCISGYTGALICIQIIRVGICDVGERVPAIAKDKPIIDPGLFGNSGIGARLVLTPPVVTTATVEA